MTLIESCQQWARSHPSQILFPDSLDVRAIKAANYINQQGLGCAVLLANPFALRQFCLQHRLAVGQLKVIDPQQSGWLNEFCHNLSPRLKDKSGQGLTTPQLMTQLQDPLWFAAAMLATGKTDYCIAGNLSATASVLRAGLRVVGLKPGINTLSSIFLMIAASDNNRVLGFADCSVIPQPTVEQLADIAISSAASFTAVTGQEARVAMLSFSSHGSAKHLHVERVQQATALIKQLKPDLIIDGEVQFDAAIVPDIARQKVPNSPLAGNANVLVFPSLEAGNIGYKIAQRLGGYAAIGPLIQGLNRPLHDLSRGCSWRDMVEVALLAVKQGNGG